MAGRKGIVYVTHVPVCCVNELGWHFKILFRRWNLVLIRWKRQMAFSSRCLCLISLLGENRPLHSTASALSVTVKLAKLESFSQIQLMGWFKCVSMAKPKSDGRRGDRESQGSRGSAPHHPRNMLNIPFDALKMVIFYLKTVFTNLLCSVL